MPFCCLLAHDRATNREDLVAETVRRMARLSAQPHRITCGRFVALAPWSDVLDRPLFATYRGHVGVGVVRLDNRAELARRLPPLPPTASDLLIVLATLWHGGLRAVPRVLGDFSFARWDPTTEHLLAVRDAVGIQTLFWASPPPCTLVSDRLGFISDERSPDRSFIADFLVTGASRDTETGHTIWANSRRVPPGGMLEIQAGRVRQRLYWSAHEFLPREQCDEERSVETFRHLFDQAVRRRIAGRSDAWAELSGGTDSSSIVATARATGGSAIAGTLTLVDELGSGDERPYSDLIVEQFGLRNEQVMNFWPWKLDDQGPPCTDEPRVMYPYYARDRQMCDVVRAHGGRVLLSGLGSDHYLSGSRLYLADWIARGQIHGAARDILAWALHDRVSFWATLLKEGMLPFVPRRIRAAWLPPEERLPSWIEPAFAREQDLIPRLNLADNPMAPLGRFFACTTAQGLQDLPHWLPLGPFQDDLEVRYPFLDRQLLEFSLQLPPRLRLRPGAPKWILRAAMRGRLPEAIRTRRGKGHIGARAVWALRHEQAQLDALIRDPILGQYGCIDPHRLRAALEAARRGQVPNTVLLLSVLALEMWMAVRANRWAAATGTLTRAVNARRQDASSIKEVNSHEDLLLTGTRTPG